jgi:spermidine synthase
MTHVPALTHPAPRAALVLGGGDGGAARQLLRHPGIERIVVAELDPDVVRLTGDYLPEVRGGAFDDPRVELVIGDAADFVASVSADASAQPFDLVVFDLTPPDSPAAGLYTPQFYRALKSIMSEDALISLHLGSPVHHTARIGTLLDGLRTTFAKVRTMAAWVPLYGSPWLMAVASDHLDPAAQSETMLTVRMLERQLEGLRFYDARLHATLLAAPRMFRDKLGQFLQL